MWDRTGENQVYVREQKAAAEQLRFDKTEKPSCLASKDHGGSVPKCPPRKCNLVGIARDPRIGSYVPSVTRFVTCGERMGATCQRTRRGDSNYSWRRATAGQWKSPGAQVGR